MSSSYIYRVGDLFGVVYNFDGVGQGITPHRHEATDRRHNVIVLRGSVRLNGEVLVAGQMATIDSDIEHSIAALEPAKILNIYLHGCPKGLENLAHGDYVGEADKV